jgi:hypothetical protein
LALTPAVAKGRRVGFGWTLAAMLAAGTPAVPAERFEHQDRGLVIERRPFNLLANSSLVSRATAENVPVPQWLSVSAASNTAPIELTTPIPHGLATGDAVLIEGIEGNVAANGLWTVTTTAEARFTLDGSAGSGAYAGGGAAFPTAGQPPPPGPRGDAGHPPWTPWFSLPASARATEFFEPTGEVSTLPVPEVPPVNSFLSQEVDGSLFHAGENLCLSIEARMPETAQGDQRLKMVVTAAFGRVRVYTSTLPATLLTPEYQRIALCFRLDDDATTEGGVLRVEFIDEHLRGVAKPMFWTRPMLNEGTVPVPWTPNVEPVPRAVGFR